VASIRDDGLENPIVTLEGKVLDGRNRDLACTNAQVTPTYVEYEGDDPLGYVLRTNLTRRHLTTSQRALVAKNLSNLERGDNQHTANAVSQEDAAGMLNVSVDSFQRAGKVIDSGDEEVIEAVRSGDMSVNAAIKAVAPQSPPDAPLRHEETRTTN
jgi:hypothetical protein